MLHVAAKKLVREPRGKVSDHRGRVAGTARRGRYTAAAIASIAFDHPVAVVDGNVERLLQRILGKMLATEELWTAANRLLARSVPVTQSSSDGTGATVCTPRQPKCLVCPVLKCARREASGRVRRNLRGKENARSTTCSMGERTRYSWCKERGMRR